ncbi:MAG TPA: hypothetical protein VGJ86_15915 [Acidimicrobiales bacterium]
MAARTNVGRLPQGRYWVGFSGFFTAVFGVMFLFGAIRQGPNDEPGEIAAAIESLAATHNIPADLDPEPLRCRWF